MVTTIRWWLTTSRLEGGERGDEELIGADIFLIKLRAKLGIAKTSSNLGPIVKISDKFPHPRRVSVESILQITATRNSVSSGGASGDRGNDEKEEEGGNEEGHEEYVDGDEALFVLSCADESDKGNEEDCDAEDEDRPT